MKKIVLAVLVLAAAGLRAGYAQDITTPANPNLKVGIGVVCDTEVQIERYAKLMGSNEAKEAIQIVNNEAKNPAACGAVIIAYKTGKQVGNVRNDKGFFKIMQIDVIAASSPQGWRMISPMATQYIAIPEIEA